MSHHNEMEVRFLSLPENEAFARVVIAAFAVQLSPTVSEIADIKTAVSEAVTTSKQPSARRSRTPSSTVTRARAARLSCAQALTARC